MSSFVNVSSSPKTACEGLTAYFIKHVFNKETYPINIALSGGSTPKMLFELWATVYKNDILWDNIRFFWVDERCVPPSHTDSNYKMTQISLLKPLDIPKQQVFRMHGEEDPENEVLRYKQLLIKELPIIDALPQFDLILLGMGNDGHTASIFPDQLHLLQHDQLCAVGIHPESKQKRITLTGKVINHARKKIFLVTGADKKEMLTKVIKLKDQAYPASHIKEAVWFTDQNP
jgi:6-phosphogluconolactonase